MIDLKTVLKPDVNQFFMGVPEYVIERAIIDGTRRFLNDSQAWTEKQKLFVGSPSIVIMPNDPKSTVIVAVSKVETMEGHERDFAFKAGKLLLNYTSNTDVYVTLSLANNKATQTAEVPDWLYSQYIDALIHSAANLIKTQQAKPWYDPDGAMFHFNEYKTYLGEALIEMTPKHVKMNPF
ncbi:TPA: hypothetical protein ACRZZI_004961 [Vibrio harveyi]